MRGRTLRGAQTNTVTANLRRVRPVVPELGWSGANPAAIGFLVSVGTVRATARATTARKSEDPKLVTLNSDGTGTSRESAKLDGGLGFYDDTISDDSDSFDTKLQRTAPEKVT